MKNLNQDLRSGQFKKAYLFYGDEAYLKRYYVNAFKDALLHGDEMNLFQAEGKDLQLSMLRDFTDTMPFFAEKRLVILRDTGLFKSASDGFSEWLDSLPETAAVIFSENEIDKRNKLYKKVSEIGRAVELSQPDGAARASFVQSILKKNRIQITKRAYDLLMERLSGSLDQITNEMDKLAAYAGEEGSVRETDIRSIITESTEIRVFDLTDALSEGNAAKAFEIYEGLIREKEPPMRLLFLISRQFSQLFSVKSLAKEGIRDDEMSRILGIRSPYVVKRLRRIADRFTESRLKQCLELAASSEQDVKTGDLQEFTALEMLMVELLERG